MDASGNDPVQILPVQNPEDLDTIRSLFVEYREESGFDLCFGGFREELATLPGRYCSPDGVLLLAVAHGTPAGCVGVRPLDGDRCELKRLYVRPAARGLRLGRRLGEEAIAFAQSRGYSRMLLDTLPSMEAAIRLYGLLGFRTAEPYNDSAGVLFFELSLQNYGKAEKKSAETGTPR